MVIDYEKKYLESMLHSSTKMLASIDNVRKLKSLKSKIHKSIELYSESTAENFSLKLKEDNSEVDDLIKLLERVKDNINQYEAIIKSYQPKSGTFTIFIIECGICMEETPAECILIPCGHKCFCENCIQTVVLNSKCPLDRKEVTSYVKSANSS